MDTTGTHDNTQILKDERTKLWKNFWKLNIGYIVMIFSLQMIYWIITNDLKYMTNTSKKRLNGWVVGYDIEPDPNTELYHLNMHGENLKGRTCIYYDYYIGSETMVNILIDKNMHKEVMWAYDPVTKECSEFKYSYMDDLIGVSSFVLVFCALVVAWFYLVGMNAVFNADDNKIRLWFIIFSYCLTMWAVCTNIFYPPNIKDFESTRNDEWLKYWFNWCSGFFVNYLILCFALDDFERGGRHLNREFPNYGSGLGTRSGINTQCAEFEK